MREKTSTWLAVGGSISAMGWRWMLHSGRCLWERAAAPSSDSPVVLWQYLAQAYPQIAHRQMGETQELSQMRVELEQPYSSLGQHRQAIALLCGEYTPGGVCQGDNALKISQLKASIASLSMLEEVWGMPIACKGIIPPPSSTSKTAADRSRSWRSLAYEQAALNSLGALYTTFGTTKLLLGFTLSFTFTYVRRRGVLSSSKPP